MTAHKQHYNQIPGSAMSSAPPREGATHGMNITVIGAAIAGPAAAYALAREGHYVTVYEQAQESDLVSAGILGIYPVVWATMRAYGLDPDKNADVVPSEYHIFGEKHSYKSPYKYVPWHGLHKMLVNAGKECGVKYVYGTRVMPGEADGDMVIDATGIAGAARDHLPSEYSGRMIFRGPSKLLAGGEFTVFQSEARSADNPDRYGAIAFTTSDAYGQSWWTMYADRAHPEHWGTIEVPVPPEAEDLPPKLRRLVMDTPRVRQTPLSHWSVRHAMMNGNIRTIGDSNGAIAPVTTSGASLAVLEGLETPVLINDTPYAHHRELLRLERRSYALELGAQLSRPQIGGYHEDPDFSEHETAIYGQALPGARRHHEGLYSL